MRLLVAALLCAILCGQSIPFPGPGGVAGPAFPAWEKGFNFRSTSAYVDTTAEAAANQTYVLGENTSQTRNGVTFQWLTAPAGKLNRNATGDRRLAGSNYHLTTSVDFSVTLPAAGVYEIRIALGDTSLQARQYLEVRDGDTVLATINVVPGASDVYIDATGTIRTRAAWPTDNAAITKTFGSTDFRVRIGTPGGSSTLAHLYLKRIG